MARTSRCRISASCSNGTTGTTLAARLRDGGMRFVIEPGIRFRGEVGEQATMFLYDPSGNALEFKAFKDPSRLFAK